MTETKLQATIELYRELMVEIRIRIGVVDAATSNKLDLSAPFINELCFLQFRMICELFALASLVAHGDIARTSEFAKKYNAKDIMNDLEKLHPDFYPVACVLAGQDDRLFHYRPAEKQPLPKDELLRLYHMCGDRLHKGNLRNILRGRSPSPLKYPELTGIAQKFRDLMTSHFTHTADGDTVILCQSVAHGDEETVTVIAAERSPGS